MYATTATSGGSRAQRHPRGRAVSSGDGSFFLGTDSAPHPVTAKESACRCTGLYASPTAFARDARGFEEEGARPHVAAFCSENGRRFDRRPPNQGRVTLKRSEAPQLAPALRVVERGVEVPPFDPNDGGHWFLEDDEA